MKSIFLNYSTGSLCKAPYFLAGNFGIVPYREAPSWEANFSDRVVELPEKFSVTTNGSYLISDAKQRPIRIVMAAVGGEYAENDTTVV